MVERKFPADDKYLQEALDFVEEELGKINCPMKNVMQITICVEEMFVNVAHYAYSGEQGEVKILLDNDNSVVSIVLEDEGVAFDPLKKEDPDITLSAEERQIGGLGIFMVKKSMNEVSYERKDGKNIFTMKKFI